MFFCVARAGGDETGSPLRSIQCACGRSDMWALSRLQRKKEADKGRRFESEVSSHSVPTICLYSAQHIWSRLREGRNQSGPVLTLVELNETMPETIFTSRNNQGLKGNLCFFIVCLGSRNIPISTEKPVCLPVIHLKHHSESAFSESLMMRIVTQQKLFHHAPSACNIHRPLYLRPQGHAQSGS